MQDVIMNKGGYNLTFDDLIVQQTSKTFAVGSYTQDIQIPLASRKVKSVVVEKQRTVNKEATKATNSSVYNSTELRLGCEYQLKIDSKNMYSLPVKNRGFQKSEADQVEGVPLVLCDYLYTWKNQTDQATGVIPIDGEGITERQANSHLQSREMATQNWIGIKLDNAYGEGVRVSNQPLIYTEKGDATASDTVQGVTERTYRVFSVVQKIMNISSGLVMVVE